MPQKNRLVSNKVMFSVKVKRTKAMQPRKIVIDNNTFWFTFFVIIVAKAEPNSKIFHEISFLLERQSSA